MGGGEAASAHALQDRHRPQPQPHTAAPRPNAHGVYTYRTGARERRARSTTRAEHHCPCARTAAPFFATWRPLSALRWMVRASSRRSTLWRVTPSRVWQSARAQSSPAGRRIPRRYPCTSWLQGATRSPLKRWSARCCRVAGGLAWAGLSRALGFPLARGWWRGKTWTAVGHAPCFARAYAPITHTQLLFALTYTDLPHLRSFHRADGLLLSPHRRPYLLSPYSISHVARSALQATHNWLTAVVLRVGNSLFSAASGVENVGVSSSRYAAPHESRVLDGQQEHESNVGGHLPRRMLNFGVDSGESAGGTLKEE